MNLSQEEGVSSKRAGRALLKLLRGSIVAFLCWEIMAQRIQCHVWGNWLLNVLFPQQTFMQRTTRLSLVCWPQHRCTPVKHGRGVSSCGKGTFLGVWAKGGAATLELELCQRVRLSEQGPHSFLSCTASSQPASWSMAPKLLWRSLRIRKTVTVHCDHVSHRTGSERRGQRHRASCLVFQMW